MSLMQPNDIFGAHPLRVLDGDTFEALLADSQGAISGLTGIRLFGVNTPELHDPDPTVRQRAETARLFTTDWLARAATWTARGRLGLFGLLVKVMDIDKYGGRVDCVVQRKTDGEFLDQALLSMGLADPLL